MKLLYPKFDQVLVWAGADFGTDIGKCHLICPVVSTEESVFENYYIAKGSFPGKDQAGLMKDPARLSQANKTYGNISGCDHSHRP